MCFFLLVHRCHRHDQLFHTDAHNHCGIVKPAGKRESWYWVRSRVQKLGGARNRRELLWIMNGFSHSFLSYSKKVRKKKDMIQLVFLMFTQATVHGIRKPVGGWWLVIHSIIFFFLFFFSYMKRSCSTYEYISNKLDFGDEYYVEMASICVA